jgi:two-component system LytT family response regulator
MLRVIVVDDEAPARRYLKRLIQAHDTIEVVGEASNCQEAVLAIANMKPEAVFLDVELGDGNGMELWSTLSHQPLVVFVTAHSDYAWRAFDIDAVDYLLKPVGAARMAEAIARLQRAHAVRSSAALAQPASASSNASLNADSVVIRSPGSTKVIKTASISAIVASGDYVELRVAKDKTELMHVTLTKLAEQLPSPPFLRLSRSLLINLDHIAGISTDKAFQSQATFSTGAAPVELGRVATVRLRKVFG